MNWLQGNGIKLGFSWDVWTWRGQEKPEPAPGSALLTLPNLLLSQLPKL